MTARSDIEEQRLAEATRIAEEHPNLVLAARDMLAVLSAIRDTAWAGRDRARDSLTREAFESIADLAGSAMGQASTKGRLP